MLSSYVFILPFGVQNDDVLKWHQIFDRLCINRMLIVKLEKNWNGEASRRRGFGG